MSTDDGRWLDDMSDGDLNAAVKEVVSKLRNRAGRSEPEGDEGWSPFVDALAVEASPETPPCVLAGLAWSGRLSIVAGPPKAGKSTMIAQAIGCRLSGEAFAGQCVPRAGSVAIVTEEPLGLLAQRLRAYGLNDTHAGAVWVAAPGHGVDRVFAAVGRFCPAVLIVDSFTPWALAAGADSLSDPAGMRRVMDALRAVADAGSGVLVVHHGRRSDGELADSRDLSAAVDQVISFDAVDEVGERCPLRNSSHRRLSYLGRWPQDVVRLEYSGTRYRLGEADGSDEGVMSG